MAPTAIKLESFIPTGLQLAIEPTFTLDDLDRARAEGFADGQQQARNDDTRQLCSALERVSQSLAEDQKLRNQVRKETTAAFIPLISGIVDALAPLHASQRIERALIAELSRLASDEHPISLRIACNDKLRDLVRRCIAETGMTEITLDDAESDLVSLSFAGGNIEFSNEKIIREINDMIEEIMVDSKI
ncbi:FliH/SctL family protein [Paracoccus onubensis]|uniref:Flagellar assembly protein FliH/Type III secretion system HrpE domain-containing protein n=1 Tax=Paracoccus onubensis TaxID=1675788 RepID=A0A418T4P3_9RHOB|nr:hypothetical protein [Paracoccus onubensis]RJE88155.1 hypothetical protein D3P04_04390 [Paracoccus onubensis]